MIKKSIRPFLICVFCMVLISCKKKTASKTIQISEDLQLTKINDHSYIHISKVLLENGKQFPCNGFVYMHNSEAYVFDTPANDEATEALINWLQYDQKTIIKGVLFNHFHRDCIEGMDIFKNHGIPCIASKKTASLIQEPNAIDHVFDNYLELKLQDKTIINSFFGEAHTSDNIISYFPDENILFGGCMIKSINAKKGNLSDANIVDWSKTVSKIKKSYPEAEIVIPGHGAYGDQNLLDYTISLFKN